MESIAARQYTTNEMLAAEQARVVGSSDPDRLKDVEFNALCLSGGGMRSASFCLGVLQALAAAGLLHKFHYLSTVSGGGYIGGWLQQLIRECEREPPEADDDPSDDPAEARIEWAERELRRPAPGALQRLRDNTNFLTPHTGIGSADTWAGIVLYVRNLMLNWLVLGPVFVFAALLPIFHRTAIWWLGQYEWIAIAAWILATAALLQGVIAASLWLPTHCTHAMTQQLRARDSGKRRWLVIRIVGGALTWACLMPVLFEFLLLHGWHGWLESGLTSRAMILVPGVHVGIMLIAYVTAWLFITTGEDTAESKETVEKQLFLTNAGPWLIASLGSGLSMLLIVTILYAARDWLARHGGVADLLTLAGPIVLLCLLLAQTTFYLGLRRQAMRSDLDREWLARINGIVLGCGAAWTLFSAACLIVPRLSLVPSGAGGPDNPDAIITIGAAIGTAVSGFVASTIGRKASSQVAEVAHAGSKGQGIASQWAMKLLPVIFVLALFGLLSTGLHFGLGRAQIWWNDVPVADPVCWPTATPEVRPQFICKPPLPTLTEADGQPLILQALLFAILGGVIWRYSTFINVNRFSMHATYRNRLTRAFLGTPRAQRDPDPFTGFDDGDDPRLRDFNQTANTGQRLFPVINMTVNMTAGARGAWSERKGASFTATPLFCGSADLGTQVNDAPQGAFVPTRYFAGKETTYSAQGAGLGTRLGSMTTISGAAASPHLGYHSSPVIAFLMTLFNVRLGAWYPNPARVGATIGEHDPIQIAKPRNSLIALLEELTGSARGDSQALYLSDGGHFENLGAYEMLRRRCRRIFVVDAGQDPNCSFFDLGMMIRKAEIDLRLQIDMRTERIAGRDRIEKMAAEGKDSSHFVGFAYGRITYFDEIGNPTGTGEIIYIKPGLRADSPTAVWAYARDNTEFPHESTGDQFFSESQFESYRTLGRFQTKRLLQHLGANTAPEARLTALFDAIAVLFGVKEAEKPADAVD